MCTFCFCILYVGKSKKGKYEKHGKGLPFKNQEFLCFLSINPFLEKTLVGFLLFFFCLPFPFLTFACLFETIFPNIPFLKPKFLSLLAFFLLLFLFLFSWCMFQPFCFYVGFVLVFVLFCAFVFFFCFSCFLFGFRSMKKSCFPCNSGVF